MPIINRKARYDYQLLTSLEAGIVLTGPEVKSVRQGQASLKDAYAIIDSNNEAWLINAHIAPYQQARKEDYQPKRRRKLLVHKNQALSLKKKMAAKNLSLVPLKMYIKRGKIKVKVALAKGKKKWQKKKALKKRDLQRETAKTLKEANY